MAKVEKGKARHKVKIRKKKVNRSLAGDIVLFLFLGIVAAYMALPLVYVINNAFKPLDEIWEFPPRFFVRNPTMNNFVDLFTLMSTSWVPFSRYIFNTFFITIVGTAGHVLLASMAAYPLAKHKFPGYKWIFTIIVLSLMFAGNVTAIPNYLIMSKLGWINSFFAVIIPALAAPLGLFLMKQFMEGIHDSLLESAKIDGASEYTILWKIVMPAVKPAWLTLILFSFQGLWNTNGGNFIYSEELKPLPYAMGQIVTGGVARTGAGFAAGLLMLVVPILIFVITQSNVIQTMSTSGIKE